MSDDWELVSAELDELRGLGLHESRVRAAQLAIEHPDVLAALVSDLEGPATWSRPTTLGALLEAGMPVENLAALAALSTSTGALDAVAQAVAANLKINGSWCRPLDPDGPVTVADLELDTAFFRPLAELKARCDRELALEVEAAPDDDGRALCREILAESARAESFPIRRAEQERLALFADLKRDAVTDAKNRAPQGLPKGRRGIKNPAR